MELAVVGTSEFVMGFELVGIRKIFEAESKEELAQAFNQALKDEDIGIILTNDQSIEKLDTKTRRAVENSITPVVVVLSAESSAQQNLREMIKKAIGIDLMEGD